MIEVAPPDSYASSIDTGTSDSQASQYTLSMTLVPNEKKIIGDEGTLIEIPPPSLK
ncbi:uncharacterized protein BT62DRAFT_938224 [Guyanagaster necrorhizus]|uniref:Uncharacterized protein n=1 Tax=Guyanagaster necrorhizus TaxID=856835 RepID=A0A9P7VGR5_9AGAR|nr:uncharacterized protein BT62DRAFT_938224 [Guyanagaster necrorhizus MCA 3950]KAG7440267.1 hypothetical protein BT62DRAFT_938224 [Guyanagaster necrorhizus MCA 3950]